MTREGFLEPDRKHFNNDKEYYLDNVKSGLLAWYYYTVMDYLSGENPKELMRDVFLANIERFYNIYVQHCIDHNVVAIPRKEAFEGKEIQEILEKWNEVYSYTEYDPEMDIDSLTK